MHKHSITARRIMIRPEEISIDFDLLIDTDVPGEDMLRQHVPEVCRVDELPADMQAAIAALFDLCNGRGKHRQGIL